MTGGQTGDHPTEVQLDPEIDRTFSEFMTARAELRRRFAAGQSAPEKPIIEPTLGEHHRAVPHS